MTIVESELEIEQEIERQRKEHADQCRRHEVHLRVSRSVKNRKPKPAERFESGEPSKDYGRGRERFRRAMNSMKRTLGFEERDEQDLQCICYVPPTADEFITEMRMPRWFASVYVPEDEPEEFVFIDLDEAEEYLNTGFSIV